MVEKQPRVSERQNHRSKKFLCFQPGFGKQERFLFHRNAPKIYPKSSVVSKEGTRIFIAQLREHQPNTKGAEKEHEIAQNYSESGTARLLP